LLVSWVGADDGATQSDPGLNHSANDESSDSDEASKISFEEDDRSSMDGSVKPTRIFERVIEVDSSPSAAEPVPEATESEFVKLGSGSSKNFRKKSRISAARAAFEED
jgi:hypothetical protein